MNRIPDVFSVILLFIAFFSVVEIRTWVSLADAVAGSVHLVLPQVTQSTSPFELTHVQPLFSDFGFKFKHKVVDKIPFMVPAIALGALTMWYVLATTRQLLCSAPSVCIFSQRVISRQFCTRNYRAKIYKNLMCSLSRRYTDYVNAKKKKEAMS